MKLLHLKYFLMLAQELHFGNAAKKLFISQPPLSRMIKSFENELGVRLFERNSRTVKMTVYGEYLRTEAEKIFQHINLVKNQLENMKDGSTGQIKIGYLPAIMHSVLPEILKKLYKMYPQITPILFEHTNDEQINALRSGDIDIAYIREPDDDKNITYEHIFDEPFVLILSDQHRFSKLKNIDLTELADEAFITFTKSCSPMRGILKICKKAGFSPNIVHETTQINSILRVVESNLGFSIVPITVIKAYDLKIKTYSLAKYNEFTGLTIAYNKSTIPKAVFSLIELTRDFKNYITAGDIRHDLQ